MWKKGRMVSVRFACVGGGLGLLVITFLLLFPLLPRSLWAVFMNFERMSDLPCDQWTLTQTFLEACSEVGVSPILLEPRILKDLDHQDATNLDPRIPRNPQFQNPWFEKPQADGMEPRILSNPEFQNSIHMEPQAAGTQRAQSLENAILQIVRRNLGSQDLRYRYRGSQRMNEEAQNLRDVQPRGARSGGTEDRAAPPWQEMIWSPTHCAALTFGVVNPSDQALERLSKAFSAKTPLFHHVIYDADPRNVSVRSFSGQRVPPIIPLHLVWWSRDKTTNTWPLHVVVLRDRGEYLWHGGLSPFSSILPVQQRERGHSLPFNVSSFAIGQEPAWIDRFAIRKTTIRGMTMLLPAKISAFLRSLEEGKLLECNHVTASHLVTSYSAQYTEHLRFRMKVANVLAITAKVLDSLGVRFWLSDGTLLGWYRQCDVIPYAGDVDVNLSIKDYSPKLTTALTDAGLHLFRRIGEINDSLEFTFTYHEIKIDLFFVYEEKNYVWYGMFNLQTLEKYRYVFPKYSLRWADFLGLKVRVPYPADMYVEATYGKHWYLPTKNYNWLLSPHNKVPFGRWRMKDRNDIIRIYGTQ